MISCHNDAIIARILPANIEQPKGRKVYGPRGSWSASAKITDTNGIRIKMTNGWWRQMDRAKAMHGSGQGKVQRKGLRSRSAGELATERHNGHPKNFRQFSTILTKSSRYPLFTFHSPFWITICSLRSCNMSTTRLGL